MKKFIQQTPEIIHYMKQNELNGAKLQKMNDAQFAQEITEYLDKTLKPLLKSLYDGIINYEEDEENILDILDVVIVEFDVLDKLYNDDISNYFETRLIDEKKMKAMDCEQFVNELVDHLNDLKNRPPLKLLYQRIMKHEETMQRRKERHRSFANMGRLLYESFVFYGSRDSKVALLYHGMSIELLFKTLYCTFDQPTSTTTEENIACNFGRSGVVLKFESADSNQYIKTLDMSLFTCFENEREHLIFETRLHIKDIFMPRIGCWIGKNIMNRLSLFDLLIHGNTIKDKRLLNEKRQKSVCKMLQSTMNDTISTYTKYPYINALIKSLLTENKTIWLDLKQIKSLVSSLKKMFISKDDGFGEFVSHLKNKYDADVCPIFLSSVTLSDITFSAIKII